MRPFPLAVLLTSTGTLLSGCADLSPTAPADPPSLALGARVGLGTPSVTVDFSSFGSSKFFVSDFYRLDGRVGRGDRAVHRVGSGNDLDS